MHRRLIPAPWIIAAALALTACATAGSNPDATPGGTPGGEPVQAPLLTYPEAPAALWTFSALDTGPVAGSADVVLLDPTRLTHFVEGLVGSAPIDAGDAWITAVAEPGGPASILGLSPTTGELLWSYRPDDGQVTNCAGTLLDGHLACTVASLPDLGSDTAVVLLDVTSGDETSRFALPLPSTTFEVAGGDLFALMAAGPFEPEGGTPVPYSVGRYSADGDELWATEVLHTPSDFGRGLWEEIQVTDALVGVELHGSVHVLAATDGALLVEESGLDWAFTPTPTGGLLVDRSTFGAYETTVLGADGSLLAVLPGYADLPPLLDGDGPSVLLIGEDGVVAELDPVSGETESTGVAPSTTYFEVAVLDGTMLVLEEALRGYDLGNPQGAPWELPWPYPTSILSDGTAVYGVSLDPEAATGGTSVVAARVADGSPLWDLPLDGAAGSDVATLARVGGYLVLVSGAELTPLAPGQ